MHAVYFFKHSKHGDDEIRWSLRSLQRHAPWIDKVWILGDAPTGIVPDGKTLEVIPHAALAWIGPWRTPVINGFLLHLMTALLPDLEPEYLFLCDDYVLLEDLSLELARRPRHVQDLATITNNRGTGLFKDSLWRTYDLLKRFGFPTLNHEIHVPTYLRKQWVLAAFRDFRDFVTEDRYHGPLAKTAILNHLHRREPLQSITIAEEGLYAGFHNKTFTQDEIVAKCARKTFLNFDDDAYNDAMREFLQQRLPEASPWEG